MTVRIFSWHNFRVSLIGSGGEARSQTARRNAEAPAGRRHHYMRDGALGYSQASTGIPVALPASRTLPVIKSR
jgi:hypothetical protein